MSKSALFMAEVKKVNTDGKKKVIQLEIVGKITPEAFLNTVDMIGSVVSVNFGDSQMAIDFDEEVDHAGVTYTTDASGVVMNVSGGEKDQESDAADGQESEEPDEGLSNTDSTSEDETSEQTDAEEQNSGQEAGSNIDREALEAFILSGQAPVFEEIPYDFPSLLSRRQNGETWIKIASSISTSSSKLQTAWSKYKKLVAEHMTKQNGEEPGAA